MYEGFLGEPEDGRTFFHGHTFTGNPLGCAAAIASLEVFRREQTLVRLQPKIRLLGELLGPGRGMDEVAEVRGRGFMVGIDLGDHDPALALGHQVTLAARERGAIIRPLGDTVVLMPPLAISKADLARLVEITADSIRSRVRIGVRPQRAGRAPRRRLDSVQARLDAGWTPAPEDVAHEKDLARHRSDRRRRRFPGARRTRRRPVAIGRARFGFGCKHHRDVQRVERGWEPRLLYDD